MSDLPNDPPTSANNGDDPSQQIPSEPETVVSNDNEEGVRGFESDAPFKDQLKAAVQSGDLDTKGCWQLVGAGLLTGILVITIFLVIPFSCAERRGRNATTVQAQARIVVARDCKLSQIIIDGESRPVDAKMVKIPSLRESLIEVRAISTNPQKKKLNPNAPGATAAGSTDSEWARRKVTLPPGEVNMEISCEPTTIHFAE